jgi:acetylornithine deacetylase/succinyl-diaminopimelate desuccinylase-like protein
MVAARGLLARLREETEAMVAETAALAQIDSGSGDADGIARVREALATLLESQGFVLEPGPVGGFGARLELDPASTPRLVIVGHVDTVWPAGTVAGWVPARDGGMLSGPGVGDMKGCLVMAAHAIAAARDAGVGGFGQIELLLVADEELGSVGSREWIERRARGAVACLGLEAGWPGGGVVVRRGAVGALAVDAHGRSAHCAGHEDRGASAVAALAALVGPLERLGDPERGALISVGTFHGGIARQVVPDDARIDVDLRAPDGDSAIALLDRVRGLVDARATAAVRLTLAGGITRPAFPLAASDRLLALATRRALELGIPLAPVASRGGSDASFAAALGVETLDGLGPICHDSCARGERIEIASLAERGALLAALICDLGAGLSQARDSGNVDAPA